VFWEKQFSPKYFEQKNFVNRIFKMWIYKFLQPISEKMRLEMLVDMHNMSVTHELDLVRTNVNDLMVRVQQRGRNCVMGPRGF